ncbi:MAG: nucleotidyltransferase domain-containing protein [Candidatus Nanoarchaeia archaeon]|nr:nucleotidyltransferase domain-containing protein [Candidatus Nanoarchaeia archaeon]
MKDWERAVNEFLKNYRNKDYVIGAVACGSYITGNPSKHSDIDLRIILKNSINWRERGNKMINGFLVEYFMNPVKQELKYFKDDYADRKRVDAHMYSTGKVLFDKTGDVKKIIKVAKKFNVKNFKKATGFKKEISKYALWDMLDNLEEIYEKNGREFYFVYYNFLSNIFYNYSQFMGYENIGCHKLLRFLTDKKDMVKYGLFSFPDKAFIKVFLKCFDLSEKNTMMDYYREVSNYVLKKMGFAGINGWKLRSKIK